jgi:PTS system fructose-specific IIC component
MNIFLLNDGTIGPAQALFAKEELTIAVNKLGWHIVPDIHDSELVIVIGKQVPINAIIAEKLFSLGELDELLANPERFLLNAKSKATPYTAEASAGNNLPAVKHIVAITACPTGVAHTFMAAEAIESEAKKRGWQYKVETRGSVGANNEITEAEIKSADIVFVAADIDVDLSKFAGKKMYRTSTGLALKKTAQEFDKALANAEIYQPQQTKTSTGSAKKKGGVYGHLLTGVSYMLPMVVAGGLIIALSFAIGGIYQEGELAQALAQIGGATAFKLMVPLLAGYISFSIADRPGLVPGMIAGMLADSMGAGFLGGIVGGYLAGYLALLLIKSIRLPQNLEALKPILIIPLISSLLAGLAMIFVIGSPVASLMHWLSDWLSGMQTANAVILGAVLGGMMCTDMGGPINKAAYAFGVGLISSQQYGPMAAIMAAGMVPPLAMAISTWLARNKFAPSEREGGMAAFILGLCFISEGAIPFAARDPIRVLPVCILGGAVTGGLSMFVGAKLMAPHGGLFVLAIPGAITSVGGYLLAIVAGAALAGVLYAFLKRPEDLAVTNK